MSRVALLSTKPAWQSNFIDVGNAITIMPNIHTNAACSNKFKVSNVTPAAMVNSLKLAVIKQTMWVDS